MAAGEEKDNGNYEYWLDIAEYDFKTAEAMFKTGRWLYVVFMCQQAIEKLVKGLFGLYLPGLPPRTHDINAIFVEFEDKISVPVDPVAKPLFAELSVHYLNNRYPDFKQKLSAAVDEAKAKAILDKSKEAFSWLETLKPQSR